MKWGKWIVGAAVSGLWLGGAQAAPLPVAKALLGEGASGIERVQFFFDDDPPPPPRGYYGRPDPDYYDPPPRRGYYPPPRGYRPMPPDAYRPRPPAYGYYGGKQEMKEYVKDRRQVQKEIQKDRVRTWNKMNGF